jgi:hypothetical protein
MNRQFGRSIKLLQKRAACAYTVLALSTSTHSILPNSCSAFEKKCKIWTYYSSNANLSRCFTFRKERVSGDTLHSRIWLVIGTFIASFSLHQANSQELDDACEDDFSDLDFSSSEPDQPPAPPAPTKCPPPTVQNKVVNLEQVGDVILIDFTSFLSPALMSTTKFFMSRKCSSGAKYSL